MTTRAANPTSATRTHCPLCQSTALYPGRCALARLRVVPIRDYAQEQKPGHEQTDREQPGDDGYRPAAPVGAVVLSIAIIGVRWRSIHLSHSAQSAWTWAAVVCLQMLEGGDE
jgi:hypothetical protein